MTAERREACQLSRLIAQELRRLREQQGLTRNALGARIGIAGQSLALIENGQRNFGLPLLEQICGALGADGLRLVLPGWSCPSCGGKPGMRRQCLDCGARG